MNLSASKDGIQNYNPPGIVVFPSPPFDPGEPLDLHVPSSLSPEIATGTTLTQFEPIQVVKYSFQYLNNFLFNIDGLYRFLSSLVHRPALYFYYLIYDIIKQTCPHKDLVGKKKI